MSHGCHHLPEQPWNTLGHNIDVVSSPPPIPLHGNGSAAHDHNLNGSAEAGAMQACVYGLEQPTDPPGVEQVRVVAQSQGSHQSGVPLSSTRGWNQTRWGPQTAGECSRTHRA